MIGFLIGDGGLTGGSTYLSTDDLPLVEHINRLCLPHNLVAEKVRERDGDYEYILSEIKRSNCSVCVKGKQGFSGWRQAQFRARLSQLGLLGKYAHEKYLPKEINSWNQKSVAALIAGIMESDGCVSYTNNSSVPIIAFGVTSYKLAQQVHEILKTRFGIYSSIIHSNKKAGTVDKRGVRCNHNLHRIVINDRESVLKIESLIKMPGRKGKLLSKLIDKIDHPKRLDSFSYSFVSETVVGAKETFDIEVNHPDHLFVLSNGLIVSNSKQLNGANLDLVVTQHDCGTKNGIPVDVDDGDNVGAVLSKSTAGHPAGTILTQKILSDIKKAGKDRISVRSSMTCESHGGICAKCAGTREKGGLPALGDNVGLAASSALSEPLSQSLLSAKHTAGVANSQKPTGFKAINALFQVPDTFPDKASLSEHDGTVDKIEKAPQGGFNVTAGGHTHYVSPDHEVLVKHGDKVESGDRISTGTINPSDMVRLKGIGAGRLNLLKQIQDTFKESGIPVSRRNAEMVVRGVVDHVRINDADSTSSYLPDETVEYSAFSKDYKPHKDATVMYPTKALNHYLEAPVLHYSIGTRVTPSVAKTLGDLGEDQVLVSPHKPAFEPHMVRLMENPSHDKDWMAQMGTSYVQKNLKKNVISGDVYSDLHGTNPIPGLAYGKEFGRPPKGTVGY